MTQEEKEIVIAEMDSSGMQYAFESYSDFKEIKDEEFHKLRIAFLKASEELEDYLR